MCVEAAPKTGCKKSSCGCGGHGHAKVAAPDPRVILALKFGEEAEHKCNCGGGNCPRHYLVLTGLLLGGFLVLHLAVNALGLWPEKFQAAVNRNHALGALLPVLEIGLIFLPLTIHVAFGLRTLRREKLKFGVEKHHHGSDLRQWLQRVTALIMLAHIFFHVVTAVYHLTNGVATGAEVLQVCEPPGPVANARAFPSRESGWEAPLSNACRKSGPPPPRGASAPS